MNTILTLYLTCAALNLLALGHVLWTDDCHTFAQRVHLAAWCVGTLVVAPFVTLLLVFCVVIVFALGWRDG